MNATKRQRPSISQDDIERLLFHLEDTRYRIVKYGSAQNFHSPERATSERAMKAIDDLAEQITGNREYFWSMGASATGDKMVMERSLLKDAKRRRLMGVNIPVIAIKIPAGLD